MPIDQALPSTIKSQLDHLMASFFRAVSFQPGEKPSYDELYALFIENGLLIKNSSSTPEITSLSTFIELRQHVVNSGQLTSFREVEVAEITELFGNVAHRFSTYEKSGTLNGEQFVAKGLISTQFISTPGGWKMSAMAWDDERSGLTIPDRYQPKKTRRVCPKGHTFYKSSDCLTCPTCQAENKPETGFLALLSAPARSALEHEGITTLTELAKYSEREILKLHGIGPRSIPTLREALLTQGLSFRDAHMC